MGLSVALSNALSGMRSGQNGLDVLSRNVANSGTPGYHRQSLAVLDGLGINSTYARNGVVQRAFNESLQHYYTRSQSESGFTSVRAHFVDRLQTVIGKPGQTGSLDTAYSAFHQSLSVLAASPDNYAVRADAVAKAQVLATTLNGLSSQVQNLRRETESKMQTSVDDLNQKLSMLGKLSDELADQSTDAASRAALMDQRDRLIAQISEIVDVRADYRADGTVALLTRSGVGLLDGRASVFEFQSSGSISSLTLFDPDPTKSGVGKLILRTPSGLVLDLVQQNILKGGELGGLIELRDKTLVQAQNQLDDVAASLAMAMSTIETQGTAAAGGGGATGYEVNLASIRNGNDLKLNYTLSGIPKQVRVIRVDDTTKLPMDVTDADGNRVIGLDFSGGAASVASQLQQALGGGFAITSPAAGVIRILDDGAANTTDITSLSARSTVTATQNAGLGLSVFVDNGNVDFTNHLDGLTQKRGFASRIQVNTDILDNMTLMVQHTAGGSLGDDDRADYLLDRLDTMRFSSYESTGRGQTYRLSGNVNDLITQMVNFQGNVAATAIDDAETQALTAQTLIERLDAEYGVDVDEEMARLMELQNAYAANARVLSSVQQLLEQLLTL
jgi:flagellar hook-associated protein 1 FlgK